MLLLNLLQFIDARLLEAGLTGASVSGPSGDLPLRFTYTPKAWTAEQRAHADDILEAATDSFLVEQYRKEAVAQARLNVADAGITVTYEPTGEQLRLWCRSEEDFANYRTFATQLKDAAEFGLPARSYRISTMQGGWDAPVLENGDNRTALRKMIAIYSDQAQRYYEQII